jgi:hypothetical protein
MRGVVTVDKVASSLYFNKRMPAMASCISSRTVVLSSLRNSKSKDPDDGNDDEQFNEREAASFRVVGHYGLQPLLSFVVLRLPTSMVSGLRARVGGKGFACGIPRSTS